MTDSRTRIAETCAMAAHTANQLFCIALDQPVPPNWDELPVELRKILLFDVEEAQNGISAEDRHLKWMKRKAQQGYTFGLRFDPIAKTHPNMVDWHMLPRPQRMKETLYLGIVRAMTQALAGALL